MGWLWKHCENGHELTHPTLTDKIVGSVHCPDCGADEPIDNDERRWAIEELVARIDKLESKGVFE